MRSANKGLKEKLSELSSFLVNLNADVPTALEIRDVLTLSVLHFRYRVLPCLRQAQAISQPLPELLFPNMPWLQVCSTITGRTTASAWNCGMRAARPKGWARKVELRDASRFGCVQRSSRVVLKP